MHFYEAWADVLPHWLVTVIISTLPIIELRGAIPVAISALGMTWYSALLYSIIGTMIPGVLILGLARPVSDFLRKRSRFFERFFSWLFTHTEKKFYKQHERFGDLALILFVATPLPGFGIWTGALAAFLFGMTFKKALWLCLLGTILAGIIVTLLTVGITSIL